MKRRVLKLVTVNDDVGAWFWLRSAAPLARRICSGAFAAVLTSSTRFMRTFVIVGVLDGDPLYENRSMLFGNRLLTTNCAMRRWAPFHPVVVSVQFANDPGMSDVLSIWIRFVDVPVGMTPTLLKLPLVSRQ